MYVAVWNLSRKLLLNGVHQKSSFWGVCSAQSALREVPYGMERELAQLEKVVKASIYCRLSGAFPRVKPLSKRRKRWQP